MLFFKSMYEQRGILKLKISMPLTPFEMVVADLIHRILPTDVSRIASYVVSFQFHSKYANIYLTRKYTTQS